MKTFKHSPRFRNAPLLLAAVFFTCFALNSVAVTVSGSASNGDTPTAASPRYSPGIADILKMLDAKVDTEVIKAYIKSAQIPYNPSAAEIIMLKERGVPSEVIVAILQRGGELRAQSPQTVAPQPSTPYPSGPAYQYGVEPVYPSYAYSYPYYYYNYYSYPYYSYAYDYSPYYFPSLYFSFYPYYRHYPYHHFYGHCYANSYAFHRGPFFGGHSVAIRGGNWGHSGFRGSGSFAIRGGSSSRSGGSFAFRGSGGGHSMGRRR